MSLTQVFKMVDGESRAVEYDYFHVDEAIIITPEPIMVPFTTSPPETVSNVTFTLDNICNLLDDQYLRHSLGWTITLVVAYVLILVIGIVGNIMVILVVGFRPQMRTVTNMFIMNLAVADLSVIVFCVPATLLANVFTPWILGSFMCKAVAYVQGVSVCASAYSLVAISLDRCKAIYRSTARRRGLSKSQSIVTTCLIWAVALLMTVPWAVTFNVITSDKDGLSYCIETWENPQHGNIYFLVVNLICYYCIPLILISISNIVIWCHVSHRRVPKDSASEMMIKQMHRRTRHGVRRMLGIVTLTFLLSWLPLYVIVTIVKFSKNIRESESDILPILLPLAQWLGSWNSSFNPVLYAFLNRKFREMFKSLLPSWFPFVRENKEKTIINNNNMQRNAALVGNLVNVCRNIMRRESNSSNDNIRRLQQNRNYYNNSRLAVNSFEGALVNQWGGKATTVVVGTIAANPISTLVTGNRNACCMPECYSV